MALLDVRDLRAHIALPDRVVYAVDGVDFSVDHGETLGIVGESGCGKSMTALALMGLLPRPYGRLVSGSVSFQGVDIHDLPERELDKIRGRDIAMIFQDPMTSLHPMLPVGEQISEVLRRHLGLSRSQAHARSTELLGEVGIAHPAQRVNDYPHQFSGGMRQRVMIAMAVACEPKLIIADEPTTALDVTVQAEVLELLSALQARHGTALILITHDMSVIAQMAHQVLVMYAGQVVETAPTRDLFATPQHPYTEALLGALPRLERTDARTYRLTAIPGRPPVIIDPVEGCRFADRCQYAGLADDCQTRTPPLREITPGHWVRSFHPVATRQTSTVDGDE